MLCEICAALYDEYFLMKLNCVAPCSAYKAWNTFWLSAHGIVMDMWTCFILGNFSRGLGVEGVEAFKYSNAKNHSSGFLWAMLKGRPDRM